MSNRTVFALLALGIPLATGGCVAGDAGYGYAYSGTPVYAAPPPPYAYGGPWGPPGFATLGFGPGGPPPGWRHRFWHDHPRAAFREGHPRWARPPGAPGPGPGWSRSPGGPGPGPRGPGPHGPRHHHD
ncbi:MAG: hypothetical protein U1E70_13015 [Acetobacteraceae bacterium]